MDSRPHIGRYPIAEQARAEVRAKKEAARQAAVTAKRLAGARTYTRRAYSMDRHEPLIYVLSAPQIECVKVGSTNSIGRRIKELLNGSAFELELVFAEFNSRENERFLHTLLGEHRLRGEWYRANDDVFNTLFLWFSA